MYSQMFKSPSDGKFKNYLKCSQIGTVRLEQGKTPTEIEGLWHVRMRWHYHYWRK